MRVFSYSHAVHSALLIHFRHHSRFRYVPVPVFLALAPVVTLSSPLCTPLLHPSRFRILLALVRRRAQTVSPRLPRHVTISLAMKLRTLCVPVMSRLSTWSERTCRPARDGVRAPRNIIMIFIGLAHECEGARLTHSGNATQLGRCTCYHPSGYTRIDSLQASRALPTLSRT